MAKIIGLVSTAPTTEGVEKLACPHCGKEYKSAAALRNHAQKEHPDSFDTTDPGGAME